ncbi:hypothetical protein T4B_9949 [Trichinella pseudospiralis]|uniref:Uncharacterized protein n=1 Tax=Trichinella pseudospiralis TaxID=6337 RepID=A0A0V1IU82_TRIPS|nr:hypothetical protein T4B_9949 [Trichinella pseudospiralis]KRZ26346.1 hypothetical protein T4C_6838 [Trichinella pseudospiralis]
MVETVDCGNPNYSQTEAFFSPSFNALMTATLSFTDMSALAISAFPPLLPLTLEYGERHQWRVIDVRFWLKIDRVVICHGEVKGCPGKLYTNLDATEVIRTSEHAEVGIRNLCWAYDELESNASTSSDKAAYFLSLDQAGLYYSRAKRYPRLPARRQDLQLTAKQTTTKS